MATTEKRPVIEVTGLKKQYKLGQIGGGTLTHDLQSWWARKRGKEDPNTLIGTDQRLIGTTFMALNGVSFTDNTAAGGSDCSFKHKMARLILKVQVSNTDGFDDTAVLEFADYKLGGLVHEGTFDVKTGTAATAGSVVSDWMLRQCTGAPKTATDKCVATFDAATGVMTFTMILLPQTLANALVLEISPDDGEYQSYSNKDMIKPALEAGYSYTYTITVKKTGLTLSGSTIENWNDGGSHAGDAKM